MSNPQPANGPVTWRVTTQTEQLGRSAQGPYVPGVLVYFTTDGGHAGQVFVPKADYTVENVQAAVSAAARLMRDVSSLSGSV